MKGVNAIIRKGGPEGIQSIVALGYPEAEALKLSSPDRFGYKGYASFTLTNNNAQINRLKERVAQLEKKADASTTKGNNERTVEGIRIVENFEADRYQLFFDGKPAPAIINEMRGGWKWSPTQKCWQRKITANAKWNLDRLLIFIAEEKKKMRLF